MIYEDLHKVSYTVTRNTDDPASVIFAKAVHNAFDEFREKLEKMQCDEDCRIKDEHDKEVKKQMPPT